MKMKDFKPYSIGKALKKFRYPFSPVKVETKEQFKGDIEAESEAASYNLTFLLLHGLFMLMWYCLVLGAWFYYFIGYVIYWFISSIILNVKGNSST